MWRRSIRIAGLTGTPEQIELSPAPTAFDTSASARGDDYVMDHSVADLCDGPRGKGAPRFVTHSAEGNRRALEKICSWRYPDEEISCALLLTARSTGRRPSSQIGDLPIVHPWSRATPGRLRTGPYS
jgi:hypothetical protein